MSQTRVGVGMRAPVNVSHGRDRQAVAAAPKLLELALGPVERRADAALGVGLRRQRVPRAEARPASRPSACICASLTGAMIARSLCIGAIGGGAAATSSKAADSRRKFTHRDVSPLRSRNWHLRAPRV